MRLIIIVAELWRIRLILISYLSMSFFLLTHVNRCVIWSFLWTGGYSECGWGRIYVIAELAGDAIEGGRIHQGPEICEAADKRSYRAGIEPSRG